MDEMKVYVLWNNSGTIKDYEFFGNKYQFRRYCKAIERKGGRVLDPFEEEDIKLIKQHKEKKHECKNQKNGSKKEE
jgi:hypothetical protein